jgi:hypothetical protein
LPSAASPFAPERFELHSREPQNVRNLVDLALSILGARTTTDGESAPVARILSVGTRVDWDAVPHDGAPAFIVPETDSPDSIAAAAAAFGEITGAPLELTAAQACRAYSFASHEELWPFSSLALHEERERQLCCARPTERVETLIHSHCGAVVLRSSARGRPVYLSLVPLPRTADARLLKDLFQPDCFMGLLPLLVFARTALGEAGWRSRELSASFLVDDPNLRLRRYGFLSLEAILEAAGEEDLHLSIAMVPLDYRKTGRRAATLMRDNPDVLSLVYHGVDHRKSEFESDIDLPGAQAALRQAIARMERHRERTGVEHASVMTFPHGDCSDTWLTAMRNVGFDAALASRALPFAHETGLDNPLYELLPAELTFAGFPVVNRFKCESAKEHLLFQAWLGKPLIIYTHHEYFSDGLEQCLGLARFLNTHVQPTWRDIGSLLADNYQQRSAGGGTEVRVFSNRVAIGADLAGAALLKLSTARADERCLVGGVPAAITRLAGGAAILEIDPGAGGAEIRFTARPSEEHVAVRRMSVRSRVRRTATELRDQCAPIASRLRRAF